MISPPAQTAAPPGYPERIMIYTGTGVLYYYHSSCPHGDGEEEEEDETVGWVVAGIIGALALFLVAVVLIAVAKRVIKYLTNNVEWGEVWLPARWVSSTKHPRLKRCLASGLFHVTTSVYNSTLPVWGALYVIFKILYGILERIFTCIWNCFRGWPSCPAARSTATSHSRAHAAVMAHRAIRFAPLAAAHPDGSRRIEKQVQRMRAQRNRYAVLRNQDRQPESGTELAPIIGAQEVSNEVPPPYSASTTNRHVLAGRPQTPPPVYSRNQDRITVGDDLDMGRPSQSSRQSPVANPPEVRKQGGSHEFSRRTCHHNDRKRWEISGLGCLPDLRGLPAFWRECRLVNTWSYRPRTCWTVLARG